MRAGRLMPNRKIGRPRFVTLSRSEGSRSVGVEVLRCAQHDRAIPLSRQHHRRAFLLLSPLLAIPATPYNPRGRPVHGFLSTS
jgi:hypothetical protein